MEALIGIVVAGVLVPLAVWLGDESAGRARWRRVARRNETISLGDSAFRGGSVQVERAEVLRERAPWWVRGLALTCYLPVGAAIVTALPWCLGVLMMSERHRHESLDAQALTLLVMVYPFGCWAAVRMWSLGRALLSGSATEFRDRLARAAWVVVPLNVAILLGALFVTFSTRKVDGMLLAVTPLATLAQITAVALAGARQIHEEDDLPAAQGDAEHVTAP